MTGLCPGCGGGTPPSSPPASASPRPSSSTTASPRPSLSPSRSVTPGPPTPSTGPAGACTASYTIVNSWPTGFQADLTVRNNSTTTALNGWTARFNFANGQAVTQMWNGTFSASGASVTVEPVTWTRTIPAGGSVSVGFLGSASSATNTVTSLGCTSP